MYCRKCGTQMEDDAAFCTECGTPIGAAVQSPIAPNVNPMAASPQYTEQQSVQPRKSHRKKNGIIKLITGIMLVIIYNVMISSQFWREFNSANLVAGFQLLSTAIGIAAIVLIVNGIAKIIKKK